MLIPDPKSLLETANSAKRVVEDREWKQYQRYLGKHEMKYGQDSTEQPISFSEFCAWLRYFEKDK